MKTSIVYVLTSTEHDYYLEQTLMSVWSLRQHTPNANVILVVDEETAQSLIGHRAQIKKYVSSIIAVDTPSDYNMMKRSRFLKTNLRNLIKGDFLYIDTDTIIARSLDDIDTIKCDICAVADKHVPLKINQSREYIEEQFSKVKLVFDENRYYINGGIMFVRDVPIAYELYNIWHSQWLKNTQVEVYTDQPSLAFADEQLNHPIEFLDGEWNCQVIENGVRFLHDAYIIHYFSSNNGIDSPYLLADPKICEMIKQSGGVLSDEIKQLVLNPRSAFGDVNKIINESSIKYLDSSLFSINKTLFRFIERVVTAYIYVAKLIYKLIVCLKKR